MGNRIAALYRHTIKQQRDDLPVKQAPASTRAPAASSSATRAAHPLPSRGVSHRTAQDEDAHRPARMPAGIRTATHELRTVAKSDLCVLPGQRCTARQQACRKTHAEPALRDRMRYNEQMEAAAERGGCENAAAAAAAASTGSCWSAADSAGAASRPWTAAPRRRRSVRPPPRRSSC